MVFPLQILPLPLSVESLVLGFLWLLHHQYCFTILGVVKYYYLHLTILWNLHLFLNQNIAKPYSQRKAIGSNFWNTFWKTLSQRTFSGTTSIILSHILPMSHFCTPWKRQKTEGFLTFSGGTEMKHWENMGYTNTAWIRKIIGWKQSPGEILWQSRQHSLVSLLIWPKVHRKLQQIIY